MAPFRSSEEFRQVMDRTFALMAEDPQMGPALRDADVPLRFVFPDLGLVANVGPGEPGGANLVWGWSDDVGWEARAELSMDSPVANKFFQGRENVPLALARRRIRTGGDLAAAMTLIPIIKPLQPRYRELLAQEYPHLVL
jgi:hypothetical protein